MMKSIISIVAAGVLCSASLATTTNHQPAPSVVEHVAEGMPAKFSSLISNDAMAVLWAGNPGGFIEEIEKFVPPVLPIPSSMNDLFSDMMHSDLKIPMTDSVMVWVEAGKQFGRGQVGDPQVFLAVDLPGANENNTHAMSGATVHFSGDMVILAQGDSVEWSKPENGDNRLISRLPNQPIGVAVDVKRIWKDHGSQLQMLGGFGAMAAQMAMMEQTQGGSREDQARMRKVQQKVGETSRTAMSGMFDAIKNMDYMTMSLGMDDSLLDMTMDFVCNDECSMSQGVNQKLIDELPAGMGMYAAMNGQFMQSMTKMDMGLMNTLMNGLSKEEHKSVATTSQAFADLFTSITGGVTTAMSFGKDGMTKWAEVEVGNSKDFIKGYEVAAQDFDQLDLGINMSSTGTGKWKMTVDGEKFGKTMGDPEAGEMLTREFGGELMLTMSPETNSIVTAKVLPPNGSFPTGKDTGVRSMLNPPKGRNLIAATSMDLRSMLAAAVMMAKPAGAPSPEQIRKMGEPVGMVVKGSAKGKSMQVNIGLDLAGVSDFAMMAMQMGLN